MEIWQKPEVIAFGLTMIFIVFLILVTFIIVFLRLYFKRLIFEQNKQMELSVNHQKDLLKKSLVIQERERERIAGELHEGLIPKLSTIAYMISSGDNQLIKDSVKSLSDSIQLARKISHDLSPPLLEKADLKGLFAEFLFPLEQEFNVELNLPNYKKLNFDGITKLHIYRIFQETINNIIKHANASQIEVCMRVTDQSFSLKVHDNGVGFEPERIGQGLGINNIITRIQFLNGKYKIRSKPGRGTTFLFCFKIKE